MFDSGANFTGITDGNGRDLTFELMTGWLNVGPQQPFISEMKLASFQDIGFLANVSAVPEPGGMAVMLVIVVMTGARRCRSKRGRVVKESM
ncbi:PEP-CTERM sorting domain-containing protein [Rhodopirellula baltica]|uniref:PEP-CTERM protein-sorting domain-containing protein n=1 Tax=Rhodopirellula baltica SWK14 TaxID=993516 RepID=L7C938_RHOBT|nr:PEP-CTERM sorting domain-containing protein [Rhodopirellula baltica]ELP30325.1 hypothetical protein RBSWK_05741 [Rhodopirellula baltica SWK14]